MKHSTALLWIFYVINAFERGIIHSSVFVFVTSCSPVLPIFCLTLVMMVGEGAHPSGFVSIPLELMELSLHPAATKSESDLPQQQLSTIST